MTLGNDMYHVSDTVLMCMLLTSIIHGSNTSYLVYHKYSHVGHVMICFAYTSLGYGVWIDNACPPDRMEACTSHTDRMETCTSHTDRTRSEHNMAHARCHDHTLYSYDRSRDRSLPRKMYVSFRCYESAA